MAAYSKRRPGADPPAAPSLLRQHFRGAATRLGPTETAFTHRAGGYDFLAVGEWMETSATAANVAWTRETHTAMAPHFAAGRYINDLNAEEMDQASAVEGAFGPSWKRLREVKRRYDPDNVFHLNQNIKP